MKAKLFVACSLLLVLGVAVAGIRPPTEPALMVGQVGQTRGDRTLGLDRSTELFERDVLLFARGALDILGVGCVAADGDDDPVGDVKGARHG